MGLLARCLNVFKSKNCKNKDLERERALDLLATHKIDAYLYMPSVGSRTNPALCWALDELAARGYVMIDQNGKMVGRLAKARVTPEDVAQERRSQFKLIKNDK